MIQLGYGCAVKNMAPGPSIDHALSHFYLRHTSSWCPPCLLTFLVTVFFVSSWSRQRGRDLPTCFSTLFFNATWFSYRGGDSLACLGIVSSMRSWSLHRGDDSHVLAELLSLAPTSSSKRGRFKCLGSTFPCHSLGLLEKGRGDQSSCLSGESSLQLSLVISSPNSTWLVIFWATYLGCLLVILKYSQWQVRHVYPIALGRVYDPLGPCWGDVPGLW